MILDYYGLKRYENCFQDTEPLSKEILASRLHVGNVQAVDENARRAVALLRIELEKSGWIEGKNTPKSLDATKADTHELSDIDCGVIEYSIRRLQKFGNTAEFHILIKDEWASGRRVIRGFLKLWLY